jgi:hypothetical protein
MVSTTEAIFVDTSWWKAMVDANDDFYTKAVRQLRWMDIQKPKLVTSNYILDESFSLIRFKCGLDKARELKERLVELEEYLRIVRVTEADDRNAWEWFDKPWKKLSFTDCASFALLRRLEIVRVATFDSHFAKAGFGVLE